MPRIWGILDFRSFRVKEKKQTDLQQKQAADAIYIYYGEETIREDKNILSKTNNKLISSKKNNLKPKVLYICLESGVPSTFIQAGLSPDFIN
jgi:hypothetical protein